MRATVLALLFATSCRTATPAQPPAPALASGATVYRGGRIYTGDPARPKVQAVAVKDGRITATGSDADVTAAAGPGARIVNLKGGLVVPGFIDAHVHIMSGGRFLDALDLNGTNTRARTLARIAEYAKAHPDRPWIVGRGWSYEAFRPGMPTRADLDKVVPERPVYLESYDGHSGWANSKALALAGVNADTKDPKGGKILRDAHHRPTGALLEDAAALVEDKIPEPSREEKKRAVERALDHAARHGVTTLCEVGASLADLAVFEDLDQEGRLKLRVVYGPGIDPGPQGDTIAAYARAAERLRPRVGPGARLLPGPLKGFVDGVIESNTAAMIEPYADGSGPGTPAQLDVPTLVDQITRADQLGLDVAYHAIGDQAVRNVLDAVEQVEAKLPPRNRRPRIEHIEVIAAEDLPRFAKLGVVASMMPAHAEPGDEPSGGVWSTKVGAARLQRSFAFADLQRAGARLAYGSDWPVVTIDPLRGIGVAVTRRGPDGQPPGGWIPNQRISVADALRGYGEGAAWALRLENETGILKPGLAADFVVLSREADLEDGASFFRAAVELTVAEGRVVYAR